MKKFICGLLTVLLIILSSTLIFSFNFKKIVVNTISNGIVKKEIIDSIDEVVSNFDEVNYDNVINEIKDNIENSEVIDNVTLDIFDEVMGYLNDGDDISIVNIDDEIEKIIDENSDILQEHGIEITEEDKQEIIDSVIIDDFVNDKIEEEIISVKDNMSSEELFVLTIYDVLTSSVLQVGLMVGILLLIFIIGLIKRSFYKWMINVGIALTCVGIVDVIFMPFVVNLLLSLSNMDIVIDIGGIVTSGYIALGVGIVLIIVYNVIKRIK